MKQPTNFSSGSDGEHRDHENTPKRLRTSFASLLRFFGSKPVPSIIEGPINDYMAWRRMEHQVKEITVRHDLHALSKFFGYAIGHNWAKRNPVQGIEIPSDADSVRMYILTQAEEMSYFQTATSEFTITIKGIIHNHGPFRDLHDVGRLILLQGNRPEEIYNLQRADVDLEKGKFCVRKGKSRAARRELQLPESREILARRLSMPASPWEFPSPKRAGLPITKLNGSREKVLEATGLSFVLYDLRHTFATRAAERGMPLPLLAKILGHANMRSIEKMYIRLNLPSTQLCCATVNRLLGWRKRDPPRYLERSNERGCFGAVCSGPQAPFCRPERPSRGRCRLLINQLNCWRRGPESNR